MKKILFVLFAMAAFVQALNAQTTAAQKSSTAFETAMLKNLQQLDTASSATALLSLANAFERIGNAEKIRWEPFYYAAYCTTVMAFQSPDKNAIDPLADKAEALLQQAEAVEKNNSEITTLLAMVNACRLTVDPMARFATKGKEVSALIAKAKTENAANPRIYLLEARMKMRTPEAFGGGKALAKQAAETAAEKFAAFVPTSAIAPAWGAGQTKALLQAIEAMK